MLLPVCFSKNPRSFYSPLPKPFSTLPLGRRSFLLAFPRIIAYDEQEIDCRIKLSKEKTHGIGNALEKAGAGIVR